MIAVLAGGVGAARFLSGLLSAVEPDDVTAIVNVGDDLVLHGLYISPDLDTVTYTLAGQVNSGRGWGLAGETWNAMDSLREYGLDAWFNLGDRDIGTHLYRTSRLAAGASLAEVTDAIACRWGIRCRILPVTNDPVRTRVELQDGEEIGFQEYFVRLHHDVAVRAVRFEGADRAAPAPGVLDTIERAEVIVIAPSNPVVSIAPILAVPGVEDAVRARRDRCVAISPIIAGEALKGPAVRLMRELGEEASVVGVARRYRDLCRSLVFDEADRERAGEVSDEGPEPVITATIMRDPATARALALTTLEAGRAR